MKEYKVEFVWKHMGFFYYVEEVSFQASNRILLMNSILKHLVGREHADFHFVSARIIDG